MKRGQLGANDRWAVASRGGLIGSGPACRSQRRITGATASFRLSASWLATWYLLGVFTLKAAAAPSLTATLDREVVPVGESVTLSLIFEGAAPQGVPQLPQWPNLTSQFAGQRQEFSLGTGSGPVSRLTLQYALTPTRPGDITIPALQVRVGTNVMNSQPLRLRVVEARAGSGAAAPNSLAFVKLLVPKTEAYVGEAMPVEIHVYFQNVNNMQMPQLRADGFSLSPPTQPIKTSTQVGNVGYYLYIFKMAATAARPGNLTLGPAECSLTVLVPDSRGRRRDPFGFFDLGPAMVERPMTLTSETVSVKVVSLPVENVPASFNGAVGSFQLAVTAGPTNLAVGDPITVRVTLTGSGVLDSLKLPPQASWNQFKTYAPTVSVQPADPLGLSGTKTFEQVVIPEQADIKNLPPVLFSFFDPQARSYRTLVGPVLPLTVRPSGIAQTPLPAITNTAPRPPQESEDILHIRAHLEDSVMDRGLLARRPWFLALQAAPVLAWLALLARRKRAEALANNPRLVRRRQVAQRLRVGLEELRAHAAAARSDDFFATLFRLLQEQIGERLSLPASAITEAVVNERMAGRGLAPSIVTELHELFQFCNQARYAPVTTSGELSAWLPKFESVIRELQRWEPSRGRPDAAH